MSRPHLTPSDKKFRRWGEVIKVNYCGLYFRVLSHDFYLYDRPKRQKGQQRSLYQRLSATNDTISSHCSRPLFRLSRLKQKYLLCILIHIIIYISDIIISIIYTTLITHGSEIRYTNTSQITHGSAKRLLLCCMI